eukprot:GHVT01097613.1.p1 GENE.GHVT01097613.1~~GHVT01097613.1.p1  ORF type:complete len:186 (-),score=39.99 GHVT01097613.1:134-691(-)
MRGESTAARRVAGVARVDDSSCSSSIPPQFSRDGHITAQAPTAANSAARSGALKNKIAHRFDVDRRAALFGRPAGQRAAAQPASTARPGDALLDENEDHLVALEMKVQELKQVSLSMKDEVSESNVQLFGMSSGLDGVRSMVGSAMSSISNLSSLRATRHVWLLLLFAVILFFFLYLLYRFQSAG